MKLKSILAYHMAVGHRAAAAMVCAALCAVGLAAFAAGTGTQGDPWLIGSPNAADVTAYIDSDKLTIKGTGKMMDWADPEDLPWFSDWSLTSIEICDGVTSIGHYAFSYLPQVTQVKIAESVTDIGPFAFAGCSALTDLVIPEGVKNIGHTAFNASSELKQVTISSTVTNISMDAFADCSKLETVTFAEGSELKSIGFCAFRFDSSLVGLEVPASVTSIDGGAFVDTPNVTVNAGNAAYEMVDGLLIDTRTKMVVSGTVDAEVTIPSSMTSIAESAFDRSLVLHQVTISAGVTDIDVWAFEGCENLTNVTFEAGSQLETIGEGAFGWPYTLSLGEIEIPANVKSIGIWAFEGCEGLSNVTMRATTPPELGTDAFNECAGDLTIYVPAGTAAAYKAADGWSDYADIIVELPKGPHDLIVLKADGKPATDGYSWMEDILTVTDNGLTVTGTTADERVVLLGTELTLKDLCICTTNTTGSSSAMSCVMIPNTVPVTVNVEGKVELHAVNCRGIVMMTGGSLFLGGTGDLAITSEGNSAINIRDRGDLIITDSVNLTAWGSVYSALVANGSILIKSTGCIDARAEGTSAICAVTGTLTIDAKATNVVARGFDSASGLGALEFNVANAVKLPAGWAVFGSPDIDAADMPVAAEMRQAPGASFYTAYVGDSVAQAVTFGPAAELTIPEVENAVASVGGVQVPAGVVLVPAGKTAVVTWKANAGYKITSGATEELVMDSDKTAKAPQLVKASEFFCLYPEGDGGVFVPAAKSTETFLGTVLDADGVAGTISVKMTKPNKRTGLFNVSATVKTLVDKASYSFKATKVQSAVDGPLTVELAGTGKKAQAHTLVVTLEGDSLTGSFDGKAIDGAKHVFAISKHLKRDAVLPFVGTWTGAFTHPLATMESVTNVLGATFSAKLTKSGAATVKVLTPDGKTLSCSSKAEVGADGVVAVPVTVWRSVKGGYESFGFRLVFAVDADGNAVCEAVDVSLIRVWTKKTGETEIVAVADFLAADAVTVTAKEFKTFAVAVDPALTEYLGPVTKNQLKFTASTGLISGSLKFGKVSGKASGVVVGKVGIGTVTVKIDGVAAGFAFTAAPSDLDLPPIVTVK